MGNKLANFNGCLYEVDTQNSKTPTSKCEKRNGLHSLANRFPQLACKLTHFTSHDC